MFENACTCLRTGTSRMFHARLYLGAGRSVTNTQTHTLAVYIRGMICRTAIPLLGGFVAGAFLAMQLLQPLQQQPEQAPACQEVRSFHYNE